MQDTTATHEGVFASTQTSDIPYLELNPEVEQAILANRQNHVMSPHCFKDDCAIRRHDKAHDAATTLRSAFERDIEKIINVPAYNRYAGKTQVFSFAENDDICRRGLHVQLVSRTARTIGGLLGLNTELIEAIALGHDVGHTPFGHVGERHLSACLNSRTGRYFNHNVHSVRVLDVLYQRNITLQTLNGVLCHNGEFAQQKLKLSDMPDFETLDSTIEACMVDEGTIKTLRPATLEGCVVRMSDMIAYLGKDRQDALRMGTIPSLDCFESTVIGTDNARILNNLIVDIVNQSLGKDHICMSEAVFQDIKRAKAENNQIIYQKEGMIDNTSNIVAEMFECMYAYLLEDVKSGNVASPIYLHHAKKLEAMSRHIDAETYLGGDANQVVCDFIASMTDDYFMALYEHLFPSRRKEIPLRSYCADL